ncbi:MAG: glutamine-hydrolyzing GMP synthase [Chloroflexi bacterium]|nr:glutamine-hydrolyzing GMP synthase [Chloroflexota bacterium]MDP6420297.1 glutamine-hydrolyzing GMP synthase [SAR202 cluster bacterium]|tara:strand:- start:3423 stop:5093 length:1671 start_codon:yes stop_codon:yes gene_type:complete
MQENHASRTTRRTAESDDLEVATQASVAHGPGASGQTVQTDSTDRQQTVLVVDFGSQYSRLIARRVRESQVYCEIIPHDAPWETVAHLNPAGVIMSGGPASVYEQDAPLAPDWVYDCGLPVLGICYGMQAMVHQLGGKVASSAKREYGQANLQQNSHSGKLLEGLPSDMSVWMSHGDRVTELPAGFSALAFTDNSPVAVIGDDRGRLGIQFHPEVVHTPEGKNVIRNFLYKICGCDQSWTPGNFVAETVESIRDQVGDGRVICGLSGGVDSAVAAALIHKAIGDQLTCIFVNNGLLRHQEAEQVRDTFERHLSIKLDYVDATEHFLGALKGVEDPERKRRIIGAEFIAVFEEEASRLGQVDFLAQGTLYPDVIESKDSESKESAKIKTHHNVGGLPEHMRMELVEPLRYLFKDEVRDVGIELGLPEEMVYRQPFPGPGLAIRIMGDITVEKLDTLRRADRIVMDEVHANGLYRELWQSFTVLTGSRSVGVTGDFRTYGHVIAIRAVASDDAMTADWARIPHEVLARISNRITNEVPGVNRVVYDITSKPPGTIEWE